MSHEQSANEESTFGEKLLGLQGFSATRARRYRLELEKLLVHRVTTFERWNMGVGAVLIGGALVIGGVSMAYIRERPEYAGIDQARLTISATCAITGLAKSAGG